MRISIVVPTLNEETWLDRCLDAVGTGTEVIVADGGSQDGTVARARARGAQVVNAPRGRGLQLNAGARAATGDILLFLHADTFLPPGALEHVGPTLAQGGVAAGCFRVHHVPERPHPPWFRLLLGLADVRARVARLPYGDQAVFTRRATFEAIGGYPDQPLMEDLELSRRLERLGRIVVLPHQVVVSARTFERSMFRHGLMLNTFPLLYRLGVPAKTLARWYHRGV